MFSPIKLLIGASLILSPSVFALPTTTITSRGTLHPCSVQVSRWYQNSFDVAYFWRALLPNGEGDNGANWWTQESDTIPEGSELPRILVGSYYLDIYNVANGVDHRTDAGKLSFTWGSQTWDSYSPGSPCIVVPVGDQPLAGAASVACNFQCDIYS
jgi:hypothetical protein